MRYNKEKYEELIELGLSTFKISKELNISQTNVRYWLKKFGLSTQCSQYNKQAEKYSDEQLIEAWNNNDSLNQCLISLGLSNNGGAFYHYKKRFSRLGINLDYDYRSLGGKNSGNITNKKALLQPKRLKRMTLNKFLKDSNIKEECNKCGLIDWNNKPLKLHIHHIDSNCKNNNLDNLEYLCPNCHNIETYAS
jgi:transposase